MRHVLVFLLVLLGGWKGAAAESAVLPTSSSLMRTANPVPASIGTRDPGRLTWFDGALYASILAYRTMDYFSTLPCLHSLYCSEAELPQAVVATRAGFAAFEIGMAASEIGSSRWLRRHGRRRLARTMDVFSISTGTWGVVHNYGVRKYD